MYDYINVVDSKESTVITYAYATPKDDNIRMEMFVHEKAHNMFTKEKTTTSGRKKTEIITPAEFGHALGFACGEFANSMPTE